MPAPPNDAASDPTSIQVHRASHGDRESFGWLVERLSPLLRAQAFYRLGPKLRRFYDPEDLVAEVWAVALTRLNTIQFEREHNLPTLLRFLATTMALQINNLMRKHIRQDGWGANQTLDTEDLAGLPEEMTGVITRAMRRESHCALLAGLESMDELDREVLIHRAIEQSPNELVAARLGLKANTVAQRYRRAIDKLRDTLDASVFAELAGN